MWLHSTSVGQEVWVSVVGGNAGRRLQITAKLDDSYLWNADAVYLEEMRICVYGPDGAVAM